MKFHLCFTPEADNDLLLLENDPGKKAELNATRKALGYLETNLRHPSLQTHPYHNISGPNGEKVFEAYVQQHRPSAYRIFWYYGPGRREITISAIIPHPE